jgi:hypothetical protein
MVNGSRFQSFTELRRWGLCDKNGARDNRCHDVCADRPHVPAAVNRSAAVRGREGQIGNDGRGGREAADAPGQTEGKRQEMSERERWRENWGREATSAATRDCGSRLQRRRCCASPRAHRAPRVRRPHRRMSPRSPGVSTVPGWGCRWARAGVAGGIELGLQVGYGWDCRWARAGVASTNVGRGGYLLCFARGRDAFEKRTLRVGVAGSNRRHDGRGTLGERKPSKERLA